MITILEGCFMTMVAEYASFIVKILRFRLSELPGMVERGSMKPQEAGAHGYGKDESRFKLCKLDGRHGSVPALSSAATC